MQHVMGVDRLDRGQVRFGEGRTVAAIAGASAQTSSMRIATGCGPADVEPGDRRQRPVERGAAGAVGDDQHRRHLGRRARPAACG